MVRRRAERALPACAATSPSRRQTRASLRSRRGCVNGPTGRTKACAPLPNGRSRSSKCNWVRPKSCFETQAITASQKSGPIKVELGNTQYVGRAQALGALLALELHRFTLVQGLVSLFLNRGKVNEHIFPARTLNESVSLCPVEPLHYALFLHLPCSFFF